MSRENKPLSIEIINERLLDYNLVVSGDYKNIRSKIICKCLVDGYTWETTVNSILANKSCKRCSKRVPILEDKEIIIEKLNKRNILVLSEFKSNKTKVKLRCLNNGCGFEWEAKPNNLLSSNQGCSECNGGKRYNNEKFDKLNENKNITRLGNYINNKTKIEFECNKKHRWFATPNDISSGYGCPYCLYKNENITHELIINNLKYDYLERRKLLKTLNRKYILDFYLELGNKIIIIEYNGQQHYKPIELWGGEKTFLKQQKRDQDLRDYCIENNILLIEIPYWITNIKDFLIERYQNVIL